MQREAANALCAELRQIFCNDIDCLAYDLEVRVFGSVGNDTYLVDSDADVAVIPVACRAEPNPTKGPDPRAVCDVFNFRALLLAYLKRHYGERLVCEQRKALLLCGEDGRRVQADIVVLLPKLWQHRVCPKCGEPQCSHGYELRSTCERERAIATWPEQHRENAFNFNVQTGGSYKRAVRAAKGILKSGIGAFPAIAPCMPPVLIENLFACVPAEIYAQAGKCPYAVVKKVLAALHEDFSWGRARYFREVSDMRDLFDPAQTWTFSQVHASIAQISSHLEGRF